MGSTHEVREPLAISTAFVYTPISALGLLFLLNVGTVSIGARTQTLTAYSTAEAERMIAMIISVWEKGVTYLSNKMKSRIK